MLDWPNRMQSPTLSKCDVALITRLKLAVGDKKEVTGTNTFQSFINKLSKLHPKNKCELKSLAAVVDNQILRIGRIFYIHKQGFR